MLQPSNLKSHFLKLGDTLRHSYWFLPAVMAVVAAVMAGALTMFDSWIGAEWLGSVSWLYESHPGGARELMSAIGGSMITVAGTVFSVTIAAVVFASGQFGPRLLSNFMGDRGNQITLGTFIATYIYCLLVLRTIRSAEESGDGFGFVPNVALLVGVALALCSIAVLIYFIHHVPSKLHINSVIEDVGSQLLAGIKQRFPRFIGDTPVDTAGGKPSIPAIFAPDAAQGDVAVTTSCHAAATGYIQLIDDDAMFALASERDLVLRFLYQPGDFVHAGRTLIEVWPAERCGDDITRELAEGFVIGSGRSALQDLRFLIDELVEIGARALSPGVNDPFTALTCLDWLGAALSDLAGRSLPSHLRVDDEGELRVIAHPLTFETYLDRSFGALLQYCAGDMVAALAYLRVLGEISLDCDDPERKASLAAYVDRLEQSAQTTLTGFNLLRVEERAREVRRALTQPAYRRALRDSAAWLGGTA